MEKSRAGNFRRVLMRQPTSQMSAATSPPGAVFELLRAQLRALDAFLHAQLADFEPEIREYASYCLDTSGKRIRPSLVFFSGWEDPPRVSDPHVRAAAVIEMIHLATLVHDDIMDGADLRRSRRTASREFGPETAVLLGDALFAQALSIAAGFPTTEVCRCVSASTRNVCSGEIMQTLGSRGAAENSAYYRRVIELKTAELFRVSCFLGARLAGADLEYATAMGEFGRHLGTAYQIYDDLADFFGDESRIGKTLGTDLTSGKFTLPLLLLLERMPEDESAALRTEMAGGDGGNLRRRVAQMVQFSVFADVMREIQTETAEAHAALAPWSQTAATRRLRELAALLEAQATTLKANKRPTPPATECVASDDQ